ncbi:MAG: hypothetical protein ACK40K_02105 [Raineya sp.]
MKVFCNAYRLLVVFGLFFSEVLGQETYILELARKVQISEPQMVSNDIYGHIYIADRQGNITQYNAKGDSLLRYAPTQPASIHILEAWKGLKILLFYKDLQSYTWLNRFLVATQNKILQNEQIGFVRLLTYAADGNLWLFDDQDFSLKKYQPDQNKVLLTTPCDLLFSPKNYQISFLREYQNQVFLVDKNFGIFIFDNFGNFKKNLHIRNINFITFLGDYVTYIQENTLYLQNLYKGHQLKIILPIEHHYKDFFLISQTHIYLFTSSKMLIYAYYKKILDYVSLARF